MYEPPVIIAKLGELLRESIPVGNKALEAHMRAVEALRFELAQSTSDWTVELYLARKNMLWPKDFDKKLTELDRTTRLHADTGVIEKDLLMLSKLEILVAERLQLISLLYRQSK